MIHRAKFLAIFLAIVGVFAVMRGAANTRPHDEKWLEKEYPMELGAFHMLNLGSENPMQSYPLDEPTKQAYEELNPMGMVTRLLTDGRRHFQVAVISSHERDSFHNPLVCFANQNFKIEQEWTHVAHVPTKSRGDVVMSVIRAVNTMDHNTYYVAYTYEGPTAMHAVSSTGFQGMSSIGLHGDMFWTELKTAKPQFATFFRFMSSDEGMSEAELLKFAAEYMDASPVRPIKG